ncbi:mannosyltransferase YkcB-related protein [Nocardioides acrostichi]|uniref:glycosyltransferase family 39 protein n=1 Tax=Nocardioides acrostichi TaxID=2784339 RepID=UPI002E2C684A|nr:glycosyltransferase family 39 protein [Nocardioides acrostichi]
MGLLAATALLYLWGLGASGWANGFYAAAAQAGSESWKAFFFGSSDAANSITVDKTPLALWPMGLSVRLFGLSSWSILVPQAIEGVLAVWVLTASIRRATGSTLAGLLSGAVMALTPVAVLMFRFDNPDAMLVLLLVASAASVLRASEPDQRRPGAWLSLAGALVGLAFLAKMLQAFLVLPAFALVYLVCGAPRLRRRIGHLFLSLAALVLAGGWWVAIVSLWPADSRPYIGGSQDNSILELTLGYNGFGRLTGDETGSVGGGGGGGGGGSSMWGSTGITRLFDSEIGGQIAWLLPTALVLLVFGLAVTWRRPRTDTTRAALLLWGSWLLVTGLVFSFMAGIFHAYYTVALAPAIAGLVGIGVHLLARGRRTPVASVVAPLVLALTCVTSFLLLQRSSDFVPWLSWVVLVGGLLTSVALVALPWLSSRLAAGALAAALILGLTGPAAYAIDTAATPHTGSIPSAGPTVSSSRGGPGGHTGGGPGGMGTPPAQMGQAGGQTGGPAGGTTGGTTGGPTGGTTGGPTGGTGGGGMGGLLSTSEVSSTMLSLLTQDASSYTWVAAAVGSNTASGYQLASGDPVMAIGGFNGSDPSPTLAQFKAYVAAGEIHYFIGGSGFGQSMGGSNASSEIASWVEQNFTSTTVDGVTVYDLTTGSAS